MSIPLKCVRSNCKKQCNIKSHSSEYRAWTSLKQRCYNTKSSQYRDYGGRGIKVCQSWLDNYDNFINDMGYKPSEDLSIDRIDNDGDYEPSNCRWATAKEQARNKRARNSVYFLKRYISGESGVQRDHVGYIARPYYLGRQTYIGWYRTETEARCALREWALKHL